MSQDQSDRGEMWDPTDGHMTHGLDTKEENVSAHGRLLGNS